MRAADIDSLAAELIRRSGEARDWLSNAEEAVVFGSFASGQATPQSDIDVLFVGCGKRRKTRTIDVQWITRQTVESHGWLQSELANHIAKHGIWIKGDGLWKSHCRVTRATQDQKLQVVGRRLIGVWVYRKRISPIRRIRLLRPILLDLCRYAFLMRREAPPATAGLLTEYARHDSRLREVVSSLSLVDPPIRSLVRDILGSDSPSDCKSRITESLLTLESGGHLHQA